MEHTIAELHQLQTLPLKDKITMTRERIKAWVDHFGVENTAISFSGGKDSTVLLDIARQDFPDIEAVHVNTGLEFPEIEDFVKSYSNVTILRPKMNFVDVIRKYGYPMISKEVSETVMGARKYLTGIVEQQKSLTDRQTDRQTDRRTISLSVRQDYRARQIFTNSSTTSYADRASIARNSSGGYDRKYRRIRGIGNFDASRFQERQGSSVSDSKANGVADKEQSDKGEYP